MPVPAGTVQIQVHFNYGAGDEEAVMTHHINPVVSGDEDLELVVDAARDAWVANWAALSAYYSDAVLIDRFKAYLLDASGHATDSAEVFPTFLGGASGGRQMPLEVAQCVNHYAFDPDTIVANRGRKRGRWYFPSPVYGAIADTHGRFHSAYVEASVNFTENYFISLADALVARGAVVLSRAAGDNYPIEWVGADNIPDVQRRRRRQQTPTLVYQTHVDYPA